MTLPKGFRKSAARRVLAWVALMFLMAVPAFAQQTNAPSARANDLTGVGTWVATGNLNVARTGHTATLLADGKVLVVGGTAPAPGALPAGETRSELFDPIAGTWSFTGATKSPRLGHTATLLSDGRVLVTGGGDRSAELYDPATGAWTLTGSMSVQRAWHTATLLRDGRVLVAGGEATPDGTATASAELYDPGTGSWTTTGALKQGRYLHTATMLQDGSVLVIGGLDYEPDDIFDNFRTFFSSAERYDPVAGSWANAGSIAGARAFHSATLLPSGKVLVAGGYTEDGSSRALQDSQLFDPATGSSSPSGDLIAARDGATATLLLNGDVLVVGGQRYLTFPWRPADVSSSESFDSTSAQWRPGPQLITPRHSHTATLLQDGRVLIAGGSTVVLTPDNYYSSAPTASAELYGNFPPGTIVPAFTGSWFDPAQNGHGLQVEVLPNREFLAAWFAFNPGGTAQAWFVGVGTYEGNAATISNVFQPGGGRWIPNFDASHIVNNPWGTLKFTFTDCNHGKVEFASSSGYGTGSMNLTRLTQPSGLACS